MKRIVVLVFSILTVISLIKNIEASSILCDFEEELNIGDSISLEALFDYCEYDNPEYGVYDDRYAYIDNENLVAKQPGTTYVYVNYTFNNETITDTCEVKINFVSGYYRVYTFDKTGKKKYLTITDTYPEGSSLCLEDKKELVTGIDKYCQIWRFEEIPSSTMSYYKISLASSLNSYVRLDGNASLVYLEKMINYENYTYKKWYFELSENGAIIKSDKMSSIKSLYYNSEKNIVYAGDESENAQCWYFEKADSEMYPFMQLYDLYGDTYTVVTERWMALNTTKDLEDLEIFPAISSSSTIKEEIKWCSSDESIAIVDESTGEVTSLAAGTVTITANPINDKIDSRSYMLQIEDFEEGIYYFKNIVFDNYLAAETSSVGSSIIVESSTEETNAKWRVKIFPNGKYGIYLLNSYNSRLHLNLDDDGNLKIMEYDGVFEPWYRDTAIWDIVIDSDNHCFIGIPYLDEEVECYNYVSPELGTNNVVYTNNVHIFYYWEPVKIEEQSYGQIVEFCYDDAFDNRKGAYILNAVEEALCTEFLDEFGLTLIINTTKIESFADVCKRINGLSYNDMCPSNPYMVSNFQCMNMRTEVPTYYATQNGVIDCTDDAVIAWEFRPYRESGYEIPAALFCGHNLYHDDGSSKNRSYFCTDNNTAMVLNVDSDVTGYSNTVIHEFGHCFGANDHYHASSTDGTVQNCDRGVKCSVCGLGAYRRS